MHTTVRKHNEEFTGDYVFYERGNTSCGKDLLSVYPAILQENHVGKVFCSVFYNK